MRFKYLALVLYSLCLFTACEEDIELKLNNVPPKFVVDGRITTDTTAHFVRLAMTADYYSSFIVPAVSGALVTVDDGEKTIILNESEQKPGYYFTPSDYYGLPGRTYKLKIENVDTNNDGVKEIYEAESLLPYSNKIDSVDYDYDNVYKIWKVLMYGKDDADREDYYMFAVAKNDSLITDQYSELNAGDDEFFNGNYSYGVWVQAIQVEDDEGNVKITLKEGDWIKLIMGSITKEFQQYIVDVSEETGFKSPMFSGPPANVYGNVSNGALGFFAAYSISCDSVQVKIVD